jgi:hypothetical protein
MTPDHMRTGRAYEKQWKAIPWWRRAIIRILWYIGDSLDKAENLSFIE